MKTKAFLKLAVAALLVIPAISCGENEKPMNKFTVTFDTMGGTSVDPIEVNEGSLVTQPEDPDITGPIYVLEGWYKDESLSQKFNFENDIITADITLYAKYIEGPTVSYQGFTYHTTKIGSQVFMRENLLATNYRDGSPIIEAFDNATWYQKACLEQKGAYGALYYENQDSIKKFGLIYSYFAIDPASNGNNHLCPEGWHVPTNDEWIEMITYLTTEGYGVEGSGDDIGKALASKSSSWSYSSTLGTVGNDLNTNDITGFSGLPGGYRSSDGALHDYGEYSYWWSSTTSVEELKAWTVALHNTEAGFTNAFYWKDDGFGVRCVKDR